VVPEEQERLAALVLLLVYLYLLVAETVVSATLQLQDLELLRLVEQLLEEQLTHLEVLVPLDRAEI
jgi:hypothetical protein